MIINPEEKTLYNAVWEKALRAEPWTTHEFRRWMDVVSKMNFAIESASVDEVAALQSQFIQLLQQKFMKG
ncbi:MAG: hypothetical protein ACYSR0_00395 [Planctomycetota bacterium]|jgi:hypothetical protein